MTAPEPCEACGCFTIREKSWGALERVVCNECARGSDTDLTGTMEGVESAKRAEGATPKA